MSLVIFVPRIVSLIESGIYEFWIEESLNLNNEALRQGLIGHLDHSSDIKCLKLKHLLGNYIILASGSILSFIVFYFETHLHKNKDRKFNTKKITKNKSLKGTIILNVLGYK